MDDNQHSLLEKYNRLSEFAKIFWPSLDTLNEQRRLIGAGDVLNSFITLPLAVGGLVWLVLSTELVELQDNTLFLIFNFGLLILFSRLSFFTIVEIRSDRYGSSEDSLASMIQWSAIFIIGPTALWLSVIYTLVDFTLNWRNSPSPGERWSLLRTLFSSLAVNTFAPLASLAVYERIGGSYPIPGLTIITISQALLAISVNFLLVLLITAGYLGYHIGVQKILAQSNTIYPLIRFFLISVGLPHLAHPFSILLADFYIEDGVAVYSFLLTGLILVAYLSRRLSLVAEFNRQQSQQLEKLEKLSRELFQVIPDPSILNSVLEQYIPGMFPSGRISIWLSPDNTILNFPEDWQGVADDAWQWIMKQDRPMSFLVNEVLPWQTVYEDHLAIVTTPISQVNAHGVIGGIFIELRALAQPWDKKSLRNLYPALLSLADQIASTLQQAEVYNNSLDFLQISQELRLAGRIQASFLPNKFPPIPGWQLAVTLLPARETSGDFFDVIELSGNRLGILVADVADKGVGSALYMALSRTLLRTYAEEYDAEPEVVFFAANNRLLKDARANLFVTIFYGILDPEQGTLTYCNAGHNPPYLIRNANHNAVDSLSLTGIAMGIEANATWTTNTVTIEPGDVLVLYTDGIPDTQDPDGDFFDDESIIDIAKENTGRSAYEIQSSIINKVQEFSANVPQIDDITLMVLVRDN